MKNKLKEGDNEISFPDSFKKLFEAEIEHLLPRRLKPGECQTVDRKICTLCDAYKISYEEEYAAKERALKKFWQLHSFSQAVEPLIASPLGRNYRTVSKRKVFVVKGRVRLGLIGIDEQHGGTSPLPVGFCAIEPAAHSSVYTYVQEYLFRRESAAFAHAFNYIVVKGTYNEFTVILNLQSFTSETRQFVNGLSKFLSKYVENIVGVFVFVDESRSRYYLSGNASTVRKGKPTLFKIFGKSEIFHIVDGRKFLYSPLSFSQINYSILPLFVRSAKELLRFAPKDKLYDMYCGYGLFALSCSELVHRVIGIDLSRDSIHDATKNAERMKLMNCTFKADDINEETLQPILPPGSTSTKIIVDPPRNGTKRGVIEYLAATKPAAVLHIFCNIDLMPAELKRWIDCGYRIDKVVPFDMFPGTKEIELMVLLLE